MPSYIVRNGQLIPRQKDFNIPTYRIIPYNSVHNVSRNDYLTNTIEELSNQLSQIKQDYHNLSNTLWKILSEIDSTSYDNNVMFFTQTQQEIYNQISYLRDESSLRLSAIIKVDENSITSPRDPILFNDLNCQLTTTNNTIYNNNDQYIQGNSTNNTNSQSPQRSFIKQIKQDSLYQIEQQEEIQSNTSKIQQEQRELLESSEYDLRHNDRKEQDIVNNFLPMIERKNSSACPKNNSQSTYNQGHFRLQNCSNNIHENDWKSSPQKNMNLTGEKRENRRTSFLLKEKISMALHEQQQLRLILEEELQKLTQQIEEKTEFLNWTIGQLRVRNQLIEKLKITILLRDEALAMQAEDRQQQRQQQKQENQLNGKCQKLKQMDSGKTQESRQKTVGDNKHPQGYLLKRMNNHSQVILEEKDKEIGLLINSLIERTDLTNEDFDFLTKSVQIHEQQYDDAQAQQQDDELRLQQKQENQQFTHKDNQLEQEQQQYKQQTQMNKTIDIDIDVEEVSRYLQYSINTNNGQSNDQEQEHQTSQPQQLLQPKRQSQSQQQNEIGSDLPNYSVLQPKAINQQPEQKNNKNITYLTKQHFLQAEKKTHNNTQHTQKENITNPNTNHHPERQPQNYVFSNVAMTQSVNINP